MILILISKSFGKNSCFLILHEHSSDLLSQPVAVFVFYVLQGSVYRIPQIVGCRSCICRGASYPEIGCIRAGWPASPNRRRSFETGIGDFRALRAVSRFSLLPSLLIPDIGSGRGRYDISFAWQCRVAPDRSHALPAATVRADIALPMRYYPLCRNPQSPPYFISGGLGYKFLFAIIFYFTAKINLFIRMLKDKKRGLLPSFYILFVLGQYLHGSSSLK